MTMEVSTVYSGAALYGTNAISEQVATASRKPVERLSQQAESTKVELSAFGQLKSATAQVETAAKALQDNKKLGAVADVAKAVQGFAEAANSQLKAAKQTALPVGSTRTANELHRAVEGFTGKDRQALSDIGIAFASDGSLKMDAKKLEAAFQANPNQMKETLNRVGKAAEDTSDRQLAGNGAVGGAISRLNEKLGNIQQQQTDVQARQEQSRKAVEEQDRRANLAQQIFSQQAFAFNGVGAYNRISFS